MSRDCFLAAAAAIAAAAAPLLAALEPRQAQGPALQIEVAAVAPARDRYQVRWTIESNADVLVVSGLSPALLNLLRQAQWTADQWPKALSVYVEQPEVLANIGLPPMLGSYVIRADGIGFQPQFPLDQRLRYRAVFRPAELPGLKAPPTETISAVLEPRSGPGRPSTEVVQVYPTAELLPENLLKFYVYFSAPMSRGGIYESIRIHGDDGRPIDLPFLEIDEELWNPTMTRLTLFIDPGRIKRGVRPLEEIGPALERGKSYTLSIDAGCQDAQGQRLRSSFSKNFRAGPPDRDPPDPGRWKLAVPSSGGARSADH